MELDRLAIHLRRRTPWEAIDLGCAMARTWWRPVLAGWLPLYLTVTIAVHLILYGNYVAAVVVMWWLKPLFDRAALEVLARSVFGDPPRPLDVLKAVFRSPGIIASLTIYRFDLARSFNLPVWHLERLKGRAATTRARTLHGRTRGHAVWATVVFLHFEMVLTFALWGAVDLFTPEPYAPEYGWSHWFRPDKPQWQQWIDGLFYAMTITILEPIYVAAGFALYLNRRTQLEAWDVELALRRLARRERGPRAAIAASLAALAFVLAAFVPGPASAAESPRKAVDEVLAQPEFGQEREVKRLRYTRGPSKPAEPGKAEASAPLKLTTFAEIMRALMWVAAIAAVAVALYYLRHYFGFWKNETKPRHAPPSAVFGLEIAPESLPADVAAAALAAAEAGRARLALSLLYRGALSDLVHNGGLVIGVGDTEGDCVRRVQAQADAAKAGYFRDLVTAWQGTAYAGRLPGAEALRRLCLDWRAQFGSAPT